MNKLISLLTTSAIAMSIATPALAEREAEAEKEYIFEEITVSATRRDQTAQKVPVTLDVFTGFTLQKSGTVDIRNIFRSAPNVNYTQFRSTEPTLFIRGIGSVFNSMGIDRPVGFYVDDVYLGRAAGALSNLVAIERVEVLKGPQGTLFGRNTTGGAISYVTKNPSDELEYRASVGYGNYDDVRLQGYISGALAEGISANLSVGFHQRDGFSTNLTTGDELENEDAISLRAKVKISTGDTSELIISGDYFNRDAAGIARIPVVGGDGTLPAQLPIDPPRNHTHTPGFGSGAAELETWGITSHFSAETGLGEVTWINSYRRMRAFEFQELFADLPGLTQSFINHMPESRQFSSEFRLSGTAGDLDWIVGSFFYFEDVDDQGDQTRFTRSYNSEISNDSFALFVDGIYSVTEQFRIGGGLRLTYDKREMEWRACTCAVEADQDVADFTGDWTRLTGRLLVEYDVSEDIYAFASYTRGYKAGGFNSQATAANLIRVIDPETVDSFELGIKSDLFDNRVRFNLTGFWTKVKDVQISALEDEISGLVVTDNFGEVTTKGIEAEVKVAVTDWFQVDAAYGYTDAEYTRSAIVGGSDINGLRVNRVPENTFSGGANLNVPVGEGIELDGSMRWSWTGDIRTRLSDVPRQDIGSFSKLDANIGLVFDEGYEVRIWGQNLTDEIIVQHIAFGGPSGVLAPPRTYGITLTIQN